MDRQLGAPRRQVPRPCFTETRVIAAVLLPRACLAVVQPCAPSPVRLRWIREATRTGPRQPPATSQPRVPRHGRPCELPVPPRPCSTTISGKFGTSPTRSGQSRPFPSSDPGISPRSHLLADLLCISCQGGNARALFISRSSCLLLPSFSCSPSLCFPSSFPSLNPLSVFSFFRKQQQPPPSLELPWPTPQTCLRWIRARALFLVASTWIRSTSPRRPRPQVRPWSSPPASSASSRRTTACPRALTSPAAPSSWKAQPPLRFRPESPM